MTTIDLSKAWELPWQKSPWQEFANSFEKQQLHHAWIIEGDQDYAINQFVTNLTKLVNCQQPSASIPCGNCLQCGQIEENNYADFYKISLLEKKHQIGVDQIREINAILVQKAYSGRYRVVTIEQAELLNTASANAFLKTLEEPGEKTLLLLQTLYPSRLLATLRSRCQQLSLTAAKPSQLQQWLQQHTIDADSNHQQALKAAGYKPLLAVNFVQQNVLQQRQQFFQDIDDLLLLKISLLQFENKNTIEFSLKLNWLEQYLFDYFRKNQQKRLFIESFYSVFQELRLQSLHTRDADKPLLLREILIKWIALFTKLAR